MSQANSPRRCGVFVQMKWTSPNAPTSSQELVNRSRPVEPSNPARCRRSSSSRPGSYIGTSPAARAATLSGRMSSPSTSKPSSARQAAWVVPR